MGNIKKMKNEHYDVEQRKELRDAMYKKRGEMESQKHSWETAESNFNGYKDSHTAEKKRREKIRNEEKDKYIKLQQEIKVMADSLHAPSRCSYDRVEAGAINDDTIYVAEQIIGKFYPKANSPRAVTENEMEDTMMKLRGRKYYEQKQNTLKNEEDKITNRHVTISERMKLMNRSGTGSGIFDIKTIKSFYDARDKIVQSKRKISQASPPKRMAAIANQIFSPEKTESKQESKNEAKVEADTKSDVKPEAKAEDKVEAKPEAKSELKKESKKKSRKRSRSRSRAKSKSRRRSRSRSRSRRRSYSRS